jgi:hypothetical protein
VSEARVLKLQAKLLHADTALKKRASSRRRISMRRALITVVLAGVLVAAGAVPSIAQVAPRTFDDLRAEEHQGEIVYVTDQGGTTVKGRVVSISATSIDLLVNDGSREWAASDVAWITQRRRHAVRAALQRVGKRWELVEPKSERSRRTLVMPEVVSSALRAHRVRQLEERLLAGSRWSEAGFVFTTRTGTPWKPATS